MLCYAPFIICSLSLPVSAVSMDRQAGVMMSPLCSSGKAAMGKYLKDNAFLVYVRDLGRWIWQRIWRKGKHCTSLSLR